MKKVALIIALVLIVSIFASCADTKQTYTRPELDFKYSVATEATVPKTTTVAESSKPVTTTTKEVTATATTKSQEDEIYESLRGGTGALCELFSIGAKFLEYQNNMLILWWEAYGFSDLKRVDKEFNNFASDIKAINDDDIYDRHMISLPNFETMLNLYDLAGYDDIVKLLSNCIDSYKKVDNICYEFSGTMKEYKEAFTPAYNDYIDKCNACIDIFIEKGLIGNNDFEKIAKLEQTASENSDSGDSLTAGQKNALKKAKSYLSHSAFSHDSLVGQLEYEGYTHDEAVYGADNCGADWNEQALKKAKSYLSHSSFSYSGLIDQLEYEEFTHEQAVYGVDNCEADWYEQAALKAESYLSHSAFSRSRLIDQLEFEGFTHEQAEYGVTQNGY